MGEILWETESIAFDVEREVFFNPQTKTDYGPNPPPGGWPISWYQSSAGIEVPVGPAGVAQTAAEAEQLRQQVTEGLAYQSQTTSSGVATGSTSATPTGSLATSPASSSSSKPTIPQEVFVGIIVALILALLFRK